MIYFDTSYLAKCYLNEPHAEKVRKLAHQADGLACSQLGRVEFWSISTATIARCCGVRCTSD